MVADHSLVQSRVSTWTGGRGRVREDFPEFGLKRQMMDKRGMVRRPPGERGHAAELDRQ